MIRLFFLKTCKIVILLQIINLIIYYYFNIFGKKIVKSLYGDTSFFFKNISLYFFGGELITPL